MQFCLLLGTDNIAGHLGEAGIVDALVATLKHESPYCVAAAAAALDLFGERDVLGSELIESSSAIPALIRVVEVLAPPANPENAPDIFRK